MAEAPRPLIVAIVGAESTGKTGLARALAEELGPRSTWVPEHLREWCAATGRTPRRDEQFAIAREQTARIEAAARRFEIVVADTTALMTAVYSRIVFDDGSLDAYAAAAHRTAALTLLTALDLPWVSDGHQRDGPHVRAPVDSLLRSLMTSHGIAWELVRGAGAARAQGAIESIHRRLTIR